jgi:hypothetical protein
MSEMPPQDKQEKEQSGPPSTANEEGTIVEKSTADDDIKTSNDSPVDEKQYLTGTKLALVFMSVLVQASCFSQPR